MSFFSLRELKHSKTALLALFVISTAAIRVGIDFKNKHTSISSEVASIQAVEHVRQVAKNYEDAVLNMYPETALYWGKTGVHQSKFSDISLSSHRHWELQEDAFIEKLNAISLSALVGTPEHVTYMLLKSTLENNQQARVCKEELWNVSAQTGVHIRLASLAEKQPLGTPEARAEALERWASVASIIDTEITNLKEGIREGYTAPQPIVNRVIHQVGSLVNAPLEKSAFYTLVERDTDETYQKAMKDIISNKINPALNSYLAYLKNDYLPVARETIGVSALPDGMACYQAKIKQRTTLDISPEKIAEYGVEHMQILEQEVASIGKVHFNTSAMSGIFRAVKENKAYWFKDEQEQLAYNNAAIARAKDKIGDWFLTLPVAPGIVKPYPLHRAQHGASGEYDKPAEDGSRPGIFYINTYNAHTRSRADQEATLFHELYPGHHLQMTLVQEDKAQLPLNQYLWNSGYGEGWGLYSERLADEMGLYSDDISRLGMLSNEAFRTARLVVDPGIHVMGWSREQAINYMKQHTALSDTVIEAEVDRYCMVPGQATSYMLGKREIDSLRLEAKERLGDRFDIREFHHQILKNGAVTLPYLREQVLSWLEGISPKVDISTTEAGMDERT